MRVFDIAPSASGFALVIHGGAGGRLTEFSPKQQVAYASGLALAYTMGRAVLEGGGSALDAVCACVTVLEDDPVFNAGRGAALTAVGSAELDASVITGDGRAGAVAVSRYAKNPVLLARKIMEETEHVLLISPDIELVRSLGAESAEPDYFVTNARQLQLANVRAKLAPESRHGTVGAVAVDVRGFVAAATSTGGMVNQSAGRVGDTPLIGSGSYARDGFVAVSCTGDGEAFMQGVVAHEIYARVRFAGARLSDAVVETIVSELDKRQATGGVIAVGADRRVVIAHNSPEMFAAYEEGGELVTLT